MNEREGDQAENWEEGYLRARDFLSSFEMKTATVRSEQIPFYSSLTDLIAAMMKRDKDFVVSLADDEKNQTENGSYINYKTDPGTKEDETIFFTTTREVWVKTTLGPHISGYQTAIGTRYIELGITSEPDSPFKNRLLPTSDYISMKVYKNGLVIGISASTGPSELQTEDLATLTEIFTFGKIAVEESG